MQAKDFLIAGGLGAASGFLQNQAVQNERARQYQLQEKKIDEERRRQELLSERERLKEQSRRSFELKKIDVQHENKMEELGVKKSSSYDPLKDQTSLRDKYQKYVSSIDPYAGEDPEGFETWASGKYPELYKKAFGSDKGNSGNTVISGEETPKQSKFQAIFNRVKAHANVDSQPVKKKGLPELQELPSHETGNGDILEPKPLQMPGGEYETVIKPTPVIKATVKKIKKEVKKIAKKTKDQEVKSLASKIGYSKDNDMVVELFQKLSARLEELRNKKAR